MSAVIARDIEMAFGSNGLKTQVLFDIDLEVTSGELTMLVGPSGCGKTTLLSILSGTLKPTGGDVEVMGKVITRMKDSEKVILRRRRIGFIFQQYNLLPALTAAENAAMALVADGMPLKTAAEKARVVLETLGMGPHADKLPRMLSGGQQQRVAIARAIVHEPDLVVCDEPTAALDAETGRQVMELLPHTEIAALDGGPAGLSAVRWRNRKTGEERDAPVRNLFLFIGADPETDWLSSCGIGLDSRGFVATTANSRATDHPGVFAIGDVRSGSVKRVGGAIGEGAAVVAEIHAYLDGLKTSSSV